MRAPLLDRAPASPSVDELAARIRAGDQDAFGAFFAAHYARVVTFVRGFVADADVAEEIAQDIFVGLWHNRQTFAQRGAPEAYLFRAARNRVANQASRGRVAAAFARASALDGDRHATPAAHQVRHNDMAMAIRVSSALPSPAWVFALIVLALLAEWASRRSRGAR